MDSGNNVGPDNGPILLGEYQNGYWFTHENVR